MQVLPFIICFFGFEVYLIPIVLYSAQVLILSLTLTFEIDIQTFFFQFLLLLTRDLHLFHNTLKTEWMGRPAEVTQFI